MVRTLSEEVRNEIKIYQASDFEIKEETPSYIIMTKNTASVGWHLLIFCIFPIIGNIIYHFAAKKTKKIMK